MADDMDRRKFLFRSGSDWGATFGGVLRKHPTLGLLAAAIDALTPAGARQSAGAVASAPVSRLLRAGEPVNARGEPFGHEVSGIAVVQGPSVKQGSRVFAVIGHANPRPACEEKISRRTTGITVVELVRDAQAGSPWRHEVSSPQNRRWDLNSAIPLDGARLDSETPGGRAFYVQERAGGLGVIDSVVPTPWNTVLCTERDGWVIEVNPFAGHAVRRFSLGRLGARQLRINSSESGKPLAVYLQSPDRLFKFVSHQRFEPREPQRNCAILSIGELFVADPGTSRWVPLTKGLAGEAWAEKMRAPADGLSIELVDVDFFFKFQEVESPSASLGFKAGEARLHAPDPLRADPFFIEHDLDGASLMATNS